jgi:hypothetical protein
MVCEMAAPAAKAKKPETRERTPEDLADAIVAIRAEIDAYLEAKIDEVKASQDGAGLPRQVIRQMLDRNACRCETALRLIGEFR